MRVLAELEEAEALVTRRSTQPRGALRVTVPAAFGRLHIAPLVPEFLRRYPELRLTLHLSDGIVNLIDEGYDLAIRIGDMKDSNPARILFVDFLEFLLQIGGSFPWFGPATIVGLALLEGLAQLSAQLGRIRVSMGRDHMLNRRFEKLLLAVGGKCNGAVDLARGFPAVDMFA